MFQYSKSRGNKNPRRVAAAAPDGGNIVDQRNISALGKCKEKILETYVFEFSTK